MRRLTVLPNGSSLVMALAYEEGGGSPLHSWLALIDAQGRIQWQRNIAQVCLLTAFPTTTPAA